MKKHFLGFLLVSLVCTSVSAQILTDLEIAEKGKGIPVEIRDITSKEVSSENDADMLKNFVATYIRQNINDYTNFVLVDSENTKLYFEQMRQTESDIYADADRRSLGNFRSGRYFFNYSIRIRNENKCDLTIAFVNVQSRTIVATSTTTYNREQIQNGTAIGRILLNIFEKIGFTFTEIQRKKMQGIAFDISDMQAQIEAYNEQLQNLETLKSGDDNFIIENQRRRILAERQMLEQNIRIQKNNEEVEKNRIETEERQRELQKQQSEELRKEIEKLTKATTSAEAEVRLDGDNYNVEKHIENVETQKALLDGLVRKKLSQISDLENQAKVEISDLQAAVDRKYIDPANNMSLYSNGELTEEAKQMIQNRKKEIESRINERVQQDVKRIISTGDKFENDLVKNIKSNSERKISYSSLNPDHKNISLIIGEYDAKTDSSGRQIGWKATLNFSLNSQYTYSSSFYISYKDLTGQEPVSIATASEEEVDAFENTIKVYDSLFRSNLQYVFATVDISIKMAYAPSDTSIRRKTSTDYSFDADAEDSKYVFEILSYKIQKISDNEKEKFATIRTGSFSNSTGFLYPQSGRLYHVWNTERAYKSLNSNQKTKKTSNSSTTSLATNKSFVELTADIGGMFSGVEDAGFVASVGTILNLTERHHLRFDVPLRFADGFEIGITAKYMFTLLKNKNNTIGLQIGAGFGFGSNHIEIPATLRFNCKWFEVSYTTAYNFEGYFEDAVVCGVVIPLGGKKR